MDDKDVENILCYITTTFESLGMKPPVKDNGKIDVLRAKGMLVGLAFQGKCLTYQQWHECMYGAQEEQKPIWPAHMPWPPVNWGPHEMAVYGGV